MKVRCKAVKYYESEYAVVQGIKGGGVPGRVCYSKGRKIMQEGYGYGRSISPSRLVLYVESDMNILEIRIDPYFKKNVGRLTPQRREKLERAMPKEIRIYKEPGEPFYRADEDDLKKWKNNAGLNV